MSLAAILILSLGVGPVAAGPKSDNPPGRPHKIENRDAGEKYCPTKALVYGTVVIPGGQCYLVAVLRDARGTFLVFAPEDTKIPPGQLVRLNTPAGPKLKGRLFLVPIETSVTIVPVNTLTLVATRIDDSGTKLTVAVVGTSATNPPSVTIDERESAGPQR